MVVADSKNVRRDVRMDEFVVRIEILDSEQAWLRIELYN